MIPSEKAKWNKKDVYFSGSYVQISGLKNEELEEQINDRLRRLCTDNLERIPPYRGVKAKAGGEPVISENSYTTVGENICLNDNNILSVTLYSSKVFQTKMEVWEGYYGQNVNYIETLNLDLNTGKDIPITAQIPGIMRGLLRSGYPVTPGFKIADIDPRREELSNCFLISDKSRCIAGSVLELVCAQVWQ